MNTTKALKLIKIELDGIGNTQGEYDDGWWETSTGAEFGKERLKNVLKIVEALEEKNQHEYLQELVRRLFDDYLNVFEISDSGNKFYPIHISCSRSMKLEPLSKLLKKLQELSGAKSNE